MVSRSEPFWGQPLADFSAKHPGEQFYQLNVAGEPSPFGFFYVSPDVSTLIWQGILNFSELDQEALWNLPPRIDRFMSFNSFNQSDTGKVTLILEARNLVEFNVFQGEQHDQYIRTLQAAADAISFARYDVRGVSAPVPFEYSFTAENPRWSATQSSELTILLPNSQPWTEALSDWVLDHHVEARTFRQRLNPIDIVETLSILRY